MKRIILFLTLSQLLMADFVNELKQASLANVNALIILTTQDMLTSGRYDFDDGASLHIVNFPLYYHFDPLFSDFNLFVNGSAGYSRLDAEVPITDTFSPDETDYETIALRFGGGIRYHSSLGINFLVGFDVIYSRIHNEYTYNSPDYIQDGYKPEFEKAFANQYSNAYTYELFWQAGYQPVWAEWKPYIILTLNYFDTKQDLSSAELLAFHSTSAGSRLKLGFETPQFLEFLDTGLSLEFFSAGNAFTGGVRDTLGFDGYGSAAAMVHLYLHQGFYGAVDEALYNMPSILSRVDLMVERVEGDGINGYNIGLGGGFSF